MAQADKSVRYQALKAAGVPLDKHYRDYTNDELTKLLVDNGLPVPERPASERDLPSPRGPEGEDSIRAELQALSQTVSQLVQLQLAQANQPAPAPAPQYVASAQRAIGAEPQYQTAAPRAVEPEEPEERVGYMRPPAPVVNGMDTSEHAGVTSSTHGQNDVLEVDAQGNKWYQREVRKPAFPKPRGRRVLRYSDPGVRTEEIKVGEYTESFEVAGDPRQARTLEARITLPSYQTGIYLPPNMPFKVHTYNGARGFDFEDVQRFYGAADLVPDTIKRCYVGTDLCYDIPTTIRAIKDEARELALKGPNR